MKHIHVWLGCFLISGVAVFAGAAERPLVLTASDFSCGGWALDTQLMNSGLGSAYLLAHGAGVPVLDAVAETTLPCGGEWRVFVKTRNWVPGAGGTNAPGRFRVRVNGAPLAVTFGLAPDAWSWVDGGLVTVGPGKAQIALRDLTGFDGRCAGVVLAPPAWTAGPELEAALRADAQERAKEQALPPEAFDLVVVGGGMAGTCAAVAAARLGVKTALIQDRPVLGGNASDEVRVWCGGEARHPIVRELRNRFMNRMAGAALSDRVRMGVVQAETNLFCFTGWSATGVSMKEKGTIASVRAVRAADGRNKIFLAPLFVDATGDGWVGYWAGADWRQGRESRAETGESLARDTADKNILGSSLIWTSIRANVDTPFGPLAWAEPFAQGLAATEGEWNWEYGLDRDCIAECEALRDRLLLAVYGTFSLAKRDPRNSRRMLDFVPFVLAKRESRRLMGEHILCEEDIRTHRIFEDAVATGSWSVDLHERSGKEKADFLTVCQQTMLGRYWIPFRSLYSRNIKNLMMAGRCLSATHVGLGSARVMNTCAQMGVAVGAAAALCTRGQLLPADIYRLKRYTELQDLIGGEWPGRPDPRRANWRYADDADPGVIKTGSWSFHPCENGDYHGEGYLQHVRGGNAEARVVFPLPVDGEGDYTLYMTVGYHWEPLAADVKLGIESAGRNEELTVDENLCTGDWQRLGIFHLSPGAKVSVRADGTKGLVIADAFAIERRTACHD